MAEVTAETKLLRILHYGSDEAVYYPGCRLQKKFHDVDNTNQLRSLISEMEQSVLFDTIRKVVREKTTLYPELLIYVLAECARVTTLRSEALSVAEEVCTTAENFLLFFKFAKGLTPHIGTGRSCRRFISNWYLKKSSLELAEMVGLTPSYRGWRHADVIKLAHIKSTDPATGAVLTYLSKGVNFMEQKYADEPKAQEVVSYLKHVDLFRKDKVVDSVIGTIERYMLTVHHLNFVLLRNKQVWLALLRRMPVDTLLDYLHLLCKYRFFRRDRQWDQEFLTAVCDILSNVNSVTETRLQPSRAYIDLCKYQFAPKYKLELAAKITKRLVQKPPVICFDLVQNLELLIQASYKNVEPTGLRYVIIVDNYNMNKRRCNHLHFMMASHAAAAIATTFYVSEDQCDILLCHSSVVQVHPKSKEPKIEELVEVFTSTEKSAANFSRNSLSGIKWIINQKKEVDVFIIIATSIKFQGLVAKLEEIRPKLLVPNFKLVLCSLCNSKQPVIEDKNIFTIIGFDDKVCSVISRFAKGVF